MVLKEEHFPRAIAAGTAFCNRAMEKQKLEENYNRLEHTLIVSPRRYGKSSLAFEAINDIGAVYGYTQFLNAYQGNVIVKRLTQCLNGLLTQLESPTQKALKTLGSFFSRAKLSIKLSELEVGFELDPVSHDAGIVIASLLESVEQLLRSKKKKAILFLDEFQDIANADISDEFQSILRDFAQRTKHIVFIISGSSRHLLHAMFSDRNKPFYRLFDQIKLLRIEDVHYEGFLQEKAQTRWQKQLSKEAFSQIVNLTELHAYYMNRLCDELWRLTSLPTVADVNACWVQVIAGEFDTIAEDLSQLTKNQRLVLQALSHYKFVKEPAAKDFLMQVGLSHSSVSLALKYLDKVDLVERLPEGYRVIDSAMKNVLVRD